MESACLACLQPVPSPSRTLYYPSSSSQKFNLGSSVTCCLNGARRRAIRSRYIRWKRVDENIGYGSPCFVSSVPFRRISAAGRKREKPFSLPPDVELEEAEAEDVDDERAGVVATRTENDGVGDASTSGIWQKFPQRYKLIVTTSLAFVICNMDKVNMSVAIIPMSHQLGWSSSTSGLVQSSFFWGYAISQLPGGFLAARYTGKTVLQAGVLVWSLATALVPMTASFLPALLCCRVLVGLGEGVSPSAATDLIARAVPVFERSRAVSFVFGGLNVGSVLGLLLAPAIIRFFGWEVVFYLFGLLGVFWVLGFNTASIEAGGDGTSVPSEQSKGNQISEDKRMSLDSAPSSETSDPHAASFNISDKAIPWKAFFRDPAVWAMMYAHFCGNWGHYNLLSWFPTYFSEELSLDLTNSALVSLLPPLGSVLVAAVASSLADHLISKGVDSTFCTSCGGKNLAFLSHEDVSGQRVHPQVRKLCQSIAFLSPAACMTFISLNPDLAPWLTAGILTVGSSLSTFTLAGLYCTHQDISPKYAGVLLGLTNSVGAIPGIVGVALTGYILDQTKSWALALFAPSIFFYLTGAVVWNVFASSEPKDFQ